MALVLSQQPAGLAEFNAFAGNQDRQLDAAFSLVQQLERLP